MSPLGVCYSRRWLKFSLIVLVKVFLFKKNILLITSSLHFHAVFCFNRIEILVVQEIGDENALNKVNTVSVDIFLFTEDSM